MGDCLKFKKAFRKPSVDCSSSSACITQLYSKSSSLGSRDGGKGSRENQNDFKKSNDVSCSASFFS